MNSPLMDELVTKARERVARDIATFEDTAMINALTDETERLRTTLLQVAQTLRGFAKDRANDVRVFIALADVCETATQNTRSDNELCVSIKSKPAASNLVSELRERGEWVAEEKRYDLRQRAADEIERLLTTLERVPTNADVDYVLQVYKPEIHDETKRAFVYIDSPTIPGLHCGSETAEKALACIPAIVARLRKDNAT